MESSKLSARLSWYVDAIRQARQAGVTWRQLADVFGGMPVSTIHYAYKIASSGRYSALEQKPLPERKEPEPVKVNSASNETEKRDQPQRQRDDSSTSVDYGGFDRPKPRYIFDDDQPQQEEK